MPINRTRDFYTQMGPGDVIIAGYFEVNDDASSEDEYLRVTPRECAIEEIPDPVTGSTYRLTLPGTGELRCAGVCLNVSPGDVSDPILWAKWAYNNSERTLYISLRNSPGAGGGEFLPNGAKVYFCAHAYPSSEAAPNIIVEEP